MNVKFIIVALLVVLTLALNPLLALADYNEGVAIANDWEDNWKDDLYDFAQIINNHSGWSQAFASADPYARWWQEESYNGQDNQKADNTELSLIIAHGVGVNGHVQVGFGSGKILQDLTRSGLGTKSDGFGHNIWWFIIECEVFNDTDYSSWLNSLTDSHMFLGFKNSPTLQLGDLTDLANCLTGNGCTQLTVQNAFYNIFLADDGVHDDNITSIIAENSDVADDDTIDNFDAQTTVDSTKLIINASLNDTTSPAAISNLATSERQRNSIKLTWTVPGDDGSTGKASAYDIRYSTAQITEQNWTSANQATSEPSPQSAGTTENFTVSNLDTGTTYYFAIKSRDGVPNWSSISNCPSARTWLRGDANDDTNINVMDMTRVQAIILGYYPPNPGSDANLDGQTNVSDITVIQYYILHGYWS